MFHRNRYNAETAVLLYLQIQKAVARVRRLMQPLLIFRFITIVWASSLLFSEVDLVVYIYSLCNGCTTNCEDKSENHHNLNPFFFNCYPTCVFLCFPFVCSSAQQCFQHLLLLEADLVVYLYSLCKSCTTNRKNKTKNNHNVTLSFFNSYFVIPNYASLSCLSATVSRAFSAASSFISDAKVVLFVFAHKY